MKVSPEPKPPSGDRIMQSEARNYMVMLRAWAHGLVAQINALEKIDTDKKGIDNANAR